MWFPWIQTPCLQIARAQNYDFYKAPSWEGIPSISICLHNRISSSGLALFGCNGHNIGLFLAPASSSKSFSPILWRSAAQFHNVSNLLALH